MNKQELKDKVTLSTIIMLRLTTDKNLTSDVLLRICHTLNCQLFNITPFNNHHEPRTGILKHAKSGHMPDSTL